MCYHPEDLSVERVAADMARYVNIYAPRDAVADSRAAASAVRKVVDDFMVFAPPTDLPDGEPGFDFTLRGQDFRARVAVLDDVTRALGPGEFNLSRGQEFLVRVEARQ